MRPGDEIKLRGTNGEKLIGRVTSVSVEVEEIEMTYGGGLGGNPDMERKFRPGRRATTITVTNVRPR